ncbi:hypothetical protein BPOR_0083g00130 [Botrytis porri]|uniref:Uncharacterized protein n=1 Tax=Botrytis porri TaxID=87229 RepID=A0A4Z1KZN6_9HELO|nr:hypothetical protein BPOR_0083g00130 [Botrytis porri]
MQLMKHGYSISLRHPLSFIYYDETPVGSKEIFIPVHVLGVSERGFERGDGNEDFGVEFAWWGLGGAAGVSVCFGTDLIDDVVLDGGEEGEELVVGEEEECGCYCCGEEDGV